MQQIIDQLYNFFPSGKHFRFFYFIFSCSISLPSLAVLILANMKSRRKALTYMIYFLLAKTVEIILGSYIEYQSANIPNGVQPYEVMFIFCFQCFDIVLLPFLINELFAITRRRQINYVFGALFGIGLALIIVPYFWGLYQNITSPMYLQNGVSIESLISYRIYRYLYWSACLYSFLIVIFKIKIVNHIKDKIFYIGCFTIFFIMAFQTIRPAFKTFPDNLFIPVTSYFFLNVFLLKYVVEKFFANANIVTNYSLSGITADGLKLTEREKEVLALVEQGLTNKNIGELLCISETTVKTHIQNIYKKVGVKNRVQLINSFKD